MKLLFLILSLILPQAVMAQEEYDRKFYCSAQDRFLSDEDFVRLALGYELEKIRDSLRRNGFAYRRYEGPLYGYEIRSVDGFLAQNPDCCSVERDPKHMRDPNTSLMMWIWDWLDGEQVFIHLLIPSDTVGEPMMSVDYYTDECGEPNYDRSSGVSNFHFTE